MVYRVPAEMLDTTDFVNMDNHQLVCSHGDIYILLKEVKKYVSRTVS